jgi:hypothetical protein
MTSLESGLVYYFIVFGFLELVLNLYHLSKKTVDARNESAKKQHQEIPNNLASVHYITKAIVMMIFGIFFSIAGLIMLFIGKFSSTLFYIPILLFALYSFIQAILYKHYWRVWSALVVYNVPLIIYLTFS